jgi:ATP phosphoribosyltransferase regulatory subunit
MSIADRWLLPDGVEEVLPSQAAFLEEVRRRLLDGFTACGYELVITPMVEYLESLLTGTGKDLDLKTFKVTDQLSGRQMGIRADITPQVARIDAHSLKNDGAVRLCYAGTVLHAKADNMLASRTPMLAGAELFGDSGTAGDLEIVSLMIESIQREGINPVHLELGDVGIFRDLSGKAGLGAADEERLFELVQRKDIAELTRACEELEISSDLASKIAALPNLCGESDVLSSAREIFDGDEDILRRIDSLGEVTDNLVSRFGNLDVYYDLSELRGYNYHTGIVFAAYEADSGQRLAKGGRYDHVGEVFGRARPATGFDIDLKVLARNSRVELSLAPRVAAPPAGGKDEHGRWALVTRLRDEGYVVVETSDTSTCEQSIVFDGGEWKLPEHPS